MNKALIEEARRLYPKIKDWEEQGWRIDSIDLIDDAILISRVVTIHAINGRVKHRTKHKVIKLPKSISKKLDQYAQFLVLIRS